MVDGRWYVVRGNHRPCLPHTTYHIPSTRTFQHDLSSHTALARRAIDAGEIRCRTLPESQLASRSLLARRATRAGASDSPRPDRGRSADRARGMDWARGRRRGRNGDTPGVARRAAARELRDLRLDAESALRGELSDLDGLRRRVGSALVPANRDRDLRDRVHADRVVRGRRAGVDLQRGIPGVQEADTEVDSEAAVGQADWAARLERSVDERDLDLHAVRRDRRR